jgi:hypothetical protein
MIRKQQGLPEHVSAHWQALPWRQMENYAPWILVGVMLTRSPSCRI